MARIVEPYGVIRDDDALDEINRVTRESLRSLEFDQCLDSLFGDDDYEFYPPAD